MKPFVAYLIYLMHFIAVIYFGIIDSNRLIGAPHQKQISIVIITAGIIIYISAFFKLGFKKSSHVNFSGLITTGIYGYVRNPQILAWIIILIGISLYLDSLYSIILTYLLWVFFKTVLQPIEERKLIEKYGEDYSDYKRNTISGI